MVKFLIWFWNNIYFQDRAAPLIAQLHNFHDHTIVIISFIIVFVLIWTLFAFRSLHSSRFLLDHQTAESVWTVIPIVFLLAIAIPSISLVYLLDATKDREVIIKIIANQWFWSYEFSDFSSVQFDSYIIAEDSLKPGLPRLLEVDNRLTLPFWTNLRFLISATDVIHSWAVPSLGIKVDAIPGRLNQASTFLDRPGVFYGQCSEICGANHRFIPIVIESVSPKHFSNFIS